MSRELQESERQRRRKCEDAEGEFAVLKVQGDEGGYLKLLLNDTVFVRAFVKVVSAARTSAVSRILDRGDGAESKPT